MNSKGKKPVSLYIHIPFCASKCAYCDFYSAPAGAAEYARYAAALCRRILSAENLLEDREIISVYFGGGTPVCLPSEHLCNILSCIFAYNVSVGAEISLEANPGLVTKEELDSLRKAGFNRISFGMQSALEDELLLLSRRHSHSDTVRAVTLARAAGFENLSLDIMLGLPGQTTEKLKKTLNALVELAPEHISAYILRLEPGTPMYRQYPNGALGDEESANLYLACCSFLKKAGYRQYEISNFARPGFESRHNSVYWELGDYLGLGPAAHSLYDGRRFSFPEDTEEFISLSGGEPLLGAVFEPKRSDEDVEFEQIMLSLRTSAGLVLEKLSPKARSVSEAEISRCEKNGLARRTKEGFALTPEGFLISNEIISEILAGL